MGGGGGDARNARPGQRHTATRAGANSGVGVPRGGGQIRTGRTCATTAMMCRARRGARVKAGTRRGASGSSQSRDRGLKGGGRRAPGTIRVWVEAQDHRVGAESTTSCQIGSLEFK